MKKLIVLLFISCFCANITFAQTASSDSLKQYVGTYKMKGDSPFQSYNITFADGSISGEADSYGANKLVIQAGTDKFQSTSSYGSIITFTRNTDKKVIGLKMLIEGSEILADKQ
ncbi:DUF3471 domain-containing protein [Emticicia sp.]|uniref:DUF3471 domain-containing protein n=1 Tax=Emticicia sp. TaxID=1930953 RepID=UPI00375330AC